MNIKSVTPGGKSVLKSNLNDLKNDIDYSRSKNRSMMTGKANTPLPVEDEEKTEVAAPVQQQAPAPIILNVDNSSSNSNQGGGTTVIKEKTVVEKPVKEEKSESEDAPW